MGLGILRGQNALFILDNLYKMNSLKSGGVNMQGCTLSKPGLGLLP